MPPDLRGREIVAGHRLVQLCNAAVEHRTCDRDRGALYAGFAKQVEWEARLEADRGKAESERHKKEACGKCQHAANPLGTELIACRTAKTYGDHHHNGHQRVFLA